MVKESSHEIIDQIRREEFRHEIDVNAYTMIGLTCMIVFLQALLTIFTDGNSIHLFSIWISVVALRLALSLTLAVGVIYGNCVAFFGFRKLRKAREKMERRITPIDPT